jgi:NADPH-dependent 2,4-dienoyl-CoA reductase/sulfur reductase-like enzyme
MDKIAQLRGDVAVVGAGPAGIAAALTAAESGSKVVLIDDNARPGGQIWRGGATVEGQPENVARWFDRLSKSGVQFLGGARVLHAQARILEAETDRSLFHIQFGKLIVATGAREVFLPIPGWTLPNVVGAGGLQALVKSGLPIQGKRVVVAGTGPLLLAVAAYLIGYGAYVVCICEQAALSALLRFGVSIFAFPKKIREAIRLRLKSRRAAYLTESHVIAAIGEDRLERVRMSQAGRLRDIPCDYLAYGYHLAPNTELAQMLGCSMHEGFVQIDEHQQTTQAGIYCAGEPTGIGGVELALLEGQIAGYAAAGDADSAKALLPARAHYRKFVSAMKATFRLRPELAALATDDTLLCRCEDVTVGLARKHDSWKAAKLHTRCGMGPCQGRVCGTAAKFLFGWNIDSQRPPVFPVRCASLAAMSSVAEEHQTNGGPQ